MIGSQVNGAYLGVNIGPINFQPAEIAKIASSSSSPATCTRSGSCSRPRRGKFLGMTIPPLKHFGPLLLVWGAAMVMLVFIRDLGSSLMFFGAFLALVYVATARISYVVLGLALFIVGAWFFASTVGHVQDRVDIWLHTFDANPCHLTKAQIMAGEDCGVGQIRQSLYAQADGGLFGQGLGQSLLKLPGPFFPAGLQAPEFPACGSILPVPQTDFIYAVVTMELGLFGACGLICVYALIAARGFKTAVMAPDGFSKLLATGLTAVFALQAFVIIGGVTKVIPSDRRHPALHQRRR